jgi:hypothetical protein
VRRPGGVRGLAATVASLTLAAATAVATHGPAHDSKTEPVFDGCRRSTGEVLLGTTPEWAYVGAENSAKTIVGEVVSAYVSGEDNPTAHESYDLLFDVDPDPVYEGLLSSANPAELHVEWEEKYFPLWALPTGGDRVTVIGNWIWDCGHWGQDVDPRNEPQGWIPYAEYGPEFGGESTEIHPPRAVFAVRSNAAAPDGVVTRANLFISSDGTPARAQEECHLSVGLNPDTGDVNEASVAQRLSGVANRCDSWQPVNDRDYTFQMLLPPGSGAVSVDVVEHERVNAPQPSVVIDESSGMAAVSVPFTSIVASDVERPRMALGVTITLRRAAPPPSTGVRVTLESVDVNTDLDTEVPYQQGATVEPSEYNLYVDVGGTWVPLHEIAPGLQRARASEPPLSLNHSVDVWLPAGTPQLRVFAMGRECDLPRMAPCEDDVELSFNESPGTFVWTDSDIFTQPVGTRVDASVTSAGGTGGCGCFTLAFSVERIG